MEQWFRRFGRRVLQGGLFGSVQDPLGVLLEMAIIVLPSSVPSCSQSLLADVLGPPPIDVPLPFPLVVCGVSPFSSAVTRASSEVSFTLVSCAMVVALAASVFASAASRRRCDMS